MTNIKDIIINETVADVLAVLALNLSQPRIDRLYTAYKFEALQSGELWGTYTRLFREGILALDEKGRTAKGPHWKEPAFIAEKKYTVE
ncbi:hypothetical protein [Pseudomonas syringae]|uniref:hypothetical protein n=1 Tax=Pseudomonas syringae TaxID=317 RepID=UPI00061AC2C1|nr:hypothetical protein [Pseudomonas syringae]